jgi:hypothetical protein
MMSTFLSLPFWLAGGERLNDWAQWRSDEQLSDQHFFAGASGKFRSELRKRLKWLLRQGGQA